MVLAYDTYVFERDRCREARDCDFVLVNLFHPPLGAPMRPGAVNELLTGLSARAGLSRAVHPHQLRHGFASNVMDAGGALDEAQELLGHARVASTQIYLHPSATVARCGRTRRCVGAGERRRPVSAVLAAVGDSRPEGTNEDPWSRLDAEFLATAGWNPPAETLAPQPDHPLLGFRCCRVQGCRSEAQVADGFCVTCRKSYQLCGASVEEFAAAGPVRQLRRGEVICAVGDCARPCRNSSITLCQVHENQRKRLDLSAQQFVNHPTARPLPGFGVCRVPVCDRQARYLRGLCGTHYARWWAQDRQGLTTDFDAWCRTAAPIASGHAVIMRGLSSAVQAEILFGLQERCRRGVITYLSQLRIVTRQLRVAGVVTIADFDVAQLPRHLRRLGQELQDAISKGATPEAEQHKDVWDMGVFGHGRKRLDFTVIAQPWLRDTAKHWVLEELPLRRGPNIVAVLRDHVDGIGVLGKSLRLHRPDEGMHPAALAAAPISWRSLTGSSIRKAPA